VNEWLKAERSDATPVTAELRQMFSSFVTITGRDPVNLDSIESVSVAVLVNRLGRLAEPRMRSICLALEVAVDCSG